MSTPLARKTHTTEPLDENAWHSWHHRRVEQAFREDAPPALTGTHWVTATDPGSAEGFPGAPGQWYRTGDSIIGITLAQPYTTTGTIQLHPGERVDDGRVILTAIGRDGDLALRTLDRNAPARTGFRTIAVFPPARRWRISATFEEEIAVVSTTSADGTVHPAETAGWVHFHVDGREHRLLATDNGGDLRVVFSDLSVRSGVHRFRLLDIERPSSAAAETVVDFNRAFLPPLAFSPHFLCTSPTASNHLEINITAGEKWPVFESGK
ncbi:DUF1684 domain-containing protein [Corynebacterium pacaense]|uniref:DUF1684 domain-containing protein n=1 Tax=Corynebacterium pacaense TaxID=1816684 RepID=UPI0015C4CE8A|nr:DUF1684 domain-containing protein [Corynebacterium pacaense]